jgi:hypothetical protein
MLFMVVAPVFHGSMTMPHWRESLTEIQSWALVAYVRALHHKPPSTGEGSSEADLLPLPTNHERAT